MTSVVDASVAAKWLVPEAGSLSAQSLLDDDLLAPDLLYPEVANILWKKCVRREIEPRVVDAAVRWMLQVPIQVHNGAGLLADAVALAQRLQHPAYDCFYLALAVRQDSSLVTADRRLYDRCQRPDARDIRSRVRLLQPP